MLHESMLAQSLYERRHTLAEMTLRELGEAMPAIPAHT